MSFVNLLSKTEIWTDCAIQTRVLNLIRATVSLEDELKANRLARTTEPLSVADSTFIQTVDAAIKNAIAEGRAAKDDADLQARVASYESAISRLDSQLVTEPTTIERNSMEGVVEVIPNPDVLKDAAERQVAQLIVDSATPEILSLFELRNPVVIPEPVIETVLPIIEV